MNDSEIRSTEHRVRRAQSCKSPYHAPRLEDLGEIGELLLGGSPGTGDSFNPGTEDPLGGGP